MSGEISSVAEAQHPAIEAIDSDGDLQLIVGTSEAAVTFRVSRVAMRLASPVWKAMLTGRFAEATAKEVKLPADPPEYMRHILLLAHLQFARLPAALSLSDLAEVVKLCDKYDCVAMMKDRIILWLAPHPSKAVGEDAAAWIWIGWVLHSLGQFKIGCAHVLDHITPSDMSKLGELPTGCKGS
jgi:hypothetical protein